jgi:hypothetical protein
MMVLFLLFKIKNFVLDLPFFETVTFLVLVLITIYRKRLSSNHEYRFINSSQREKARKRLFQHFTRRRYSSVNVLANDTTDETTLSSSLNNLTFNITSNLANLPPFPSVHDLKDNIISSTSNLMDNILIDEDQLFESHLAQVHLASENFSFLSLSDEVLFHILHHLETIEIVKFCLSSSKYYKEIVNNEFLWEQLWIITYSHIWQLEPIKEIRQKRGIYWDPLLHYPSPQFGWCKFYIAFEICWIDWVSLRRLFFFFFFRFLVDFGRVVYKRRLLSGRQ